MEGDEEEVVTVLEVDDMILLLKLKIGAVLRQSRRIKPVKASIDRQGGEEGEEEDGIRLAVAVMSFEGGMGKVDKGITAGPLQKSLRCLRSNWLPQR